MHFRSILILDTFTILTIIIMTWIRDHGACYDASQRTPIDSPTLQYHTLVMIIILCELMIMITMIVSMIVTITNLIVMNTMTMVMF